MATCSVMEEKGLNPCFSGSWFGSFTLALSFEEERQCLNPCFSGSWFGSVNKLLLKWQRVRVLILVLVEVGLGELKFLTYSLVQL